MKILVVDDNAHHAELAVHRLQQEGWKVSTTDIAEPSDSWTDFDFILMDYSMPKSTGIELMKILKGLKIRTPVVFLTGHGSEEIAAEAIKLGAYDYLVKDTKLLYLDRLPSIIREARSKHELIETNRFLVQELRRTNERLQRMTMTDEMTGMNNYRSLKRHLQQELSRCARYGNSLSICILDIDGFKQINDTQGHPAGDYILKQIARILGERTRNVDFVGRYAGDEFVVVFPDTQLADAVRLCDRIRSEVCSKPFQFEGQEIAVTISMGVANFESKKRATVDTLLAAADRCLYQAKRSGRNRVSSLLRVVDKRSDSASPVAGL